MEDDVGAINEIGIDDAYALADEVLKMAKALGFTLPGTIASTSIEIDGKAYQLSMVREA